MNSEPGKVTVVGGMPTAQGATSPESLPSSTTNFVKLLEEQGFEVDVAVPRKTAITSI
ncbi:hypothetical protein [Ornithinimicrobium sp. INDO-MA30-4]|uniref:hypothetical protein n=1 Tax=Ornithinimicrobium sp. INDO-MA30-4 TaxID=2908651 RepID=UPI001F2C312B|nr:hypothetical protein [Ornithinimicrobium sp. INDO-MA30-4]UJH70063.1 hypothetical protein L0A91_12780 [Ornithinimicrobium sp. INDO-MA30-4]